MKSGLPCINDKLLTCPKNMWMIQFPIRSKMDELGEIFALSLSIQFLLAYFKQRERRAKSFEQTGAQLNPVASANAAGIHQRVNQKH